MQGSSIKKNKTPCKLLFLYICPTKEKHTWGEVLAAAFAKISRN